MPDGLRDFFEGRPWWMNVMLVFCAWMSFVYLPWDIFIKPVAEDQEVWFGFLLTGWAAKLTAPLHWAIYAAGFVGFHKMRSWMHPWAALYVVQIAVGMLVWCVLDERGPGLIGGVVSALPFAGIAYALWQAKHRFGETGAGTVT